MAGKVLLERGGDLHTETLAVFDDTRTYRYLLRYQWNMVGQHLVWLMLNPSIADAHHPDPTIIRCLHHARRLGAGGMTVLNLFALVATDPAMLVGHPDPAGPLNDNYLTTFTRGKLVVAAWGAAPIAQPRAVEVTRLLTDSGTKLWSLGGTTKAGCPRHPLYLPYTATLAPYPPVG